MTRLSTLLLLTAVWALSVGVASARELRPCASDDSRPAAETGINSDKKNETKEADARLHNMEKRMLEMQEMIRALADQMRQLKNELAAATCGQASPNPQPVEVPVTAPTEAGETRTGVEQNTPGDKNQKPRIVESVLPGVKLSGAATLFAYSPFKVEGARSFFELYSAGVNLDREDEKLGFHVEFRYRSTKFRPFFDSNSWVQEAYVKTKAPGGTLKVGRIYKQVGIFSDYSFFGNLPYFDGLKYNPEWGVSYEGDNKITNWLSFQHYAQYFRSDGRTNGSFPGRDVVSDSGSQRRNAVVARGAPTFKLSDRISLAVGGTFERGQVARPIESDNNTYRRVGGEATLTIGRGALFGEVIHQNFDGARFPDLPKVTYAAVGGNYDFKKFSLHVNYSQGNYDAPGRRKEYIIQPGLVIPLGKGFSLSNEFNYWIIDRGRKSIFDRSLNTVLIFNY